MNSTPHLLSNSKEVKRISEVLDCPVEIVRYCMLQIGPSLPAIEAYWQMNKERLLEEFQVTKK